MKMYYVVYINFTSLTARVLHHLLSLLVKGLAPRETILSNLPPQYLTPASFT